MSFIGAHSACVRGSACRINPSVFHRLPAGRASAPAPAPTTTAPRNPPRVRYTSVPLRVVITAEANATETTILQLNETQPRLAAAFREHGLITATSVTLTLNEGFTSAETGSLVAEFLPSTTTSRSVTEMLENCGGTFSAGMHLPVSENFSRAVNGISRNLHSAQHPTGAPGLALAYRNTASSDKTMLLQFEVVLRRPLTAAAAASAPLTVAQPASGQGVASLVAGTSNLWHVSLPAGQRGRVDSGTPTFGTVSITGTTPAAATALASLISSVTDFTTTSALHLYWRA